jgi:hypothetical protein
VIEDDAGSGAEVGEVDGEPDVEERGPVGGSEFDVED